MLHKNQNEICVLMSVYHKDNPNNFYIALQSMINQEEPCDIYLQVDGPVEKNIKDVIGKFELKNLKVKFHDKNIGLPAILNLGIKYAKDNSYKYIARMDADDFSFKNRLSTQKNYLERSQADLIGSNAEFVFKNQTVRSSNFFMDNSLVSQIILKRNPIYHSSVFAKIETFDSATYNEKFVKAQDWILWATLISSGKKIEIIEPVLIRYNIDEEYIKKRSRVSLILYGVYAHWNVLKILRSPNKFYMIYSLINIIVKTLPVRFQESIYKLKT